MKGNNRASDKAKKQIYNAKAVTGMKKTPAKMMKKKK